MVTPPSLSSQHSHLYNAPPPKTDIEIHTIEHNHPLAPLQRSKRGVALFERLWPQHSTITISLTNMTESEKKLTKKNIRKWAPHINLKLTFVDGPAGDIRITSISTPEAGWSRIGKDAKSIPLSEFTMGINFEKDHDKVIRTIQHEFGHALGLDHEHKHPDRTLDFNTEKLYAFADKIGFGRSQVDSQILFKYHPKRAKVKTSNYDQKSIMHYEFEPGVLQSEKGVPLNIALSKEDKKFIKTLYPQTLPSAAETAKFFDSSAATKKLWPHHSTVTISLLNMNQEQKKLIRKHIKTLKPHINVTLKIINKPHGDIRIAPAANDIKSWSTVGTDAKNIHASQPTSGLNFDSSNKDPGVLVKNLLGKALGFEMP